VNLIDSRSSSRPLSPAMGGFCAKRATLTTDVADRFRKMRQRFNYVALKTIEVDDLVVVRRAFKSGGDDPLNLQKGTRGIVTDVDHEHGEAVVEFEGIEEPQWIAAKNFKHLVKAVDRLPTEAEIKMDRERKNEKQRREGSGLSMQFFEGDRIIVKKTFTSGGDEPTEVQKGSQGVVQFREDDEIVIEFEGNEEGVWVQARDYHKLELRSEPDPGLPTQV